VAKNSVRDNDDPDKPPVGLEIPPRKYLRMREHQIALYRGFPFKLAYNARVVAINQMLRQREALAAGLPGPDVTPVWSSIGPAPIPNGQVAGGATNIPVSGRVTAIVVDPLNANLVYVGTAQGGVYRTSNAGAATPTWTPLMDNALSLAVGALALDPADHTKLFVGTGEGNFSLDSYAGVGLYRITGANGVSPTLQGPFETKVAGTGTAAGPHAFQGESITSIAFDPHNQNRVFIGTSLGFSGASGDQSPSAAPIGLYFSSNAQAATPTFSRVGSIPGAPNSAVTDVLFAPGSSSILLVGVVDLTGTVSGLYRSTNANVAATGTGGEVPAFSKRVTLGPGLYNIKLAANKVGATTTVLAALDSTSGGKLMKSTNAGQTFPTTLNSATGFCDGQCYYDVAVAIDPSTSQKIYLGGSADPQAGTRPSQFLRSANGSTFTVSDTNLHADTHAIAIAKSNRAVIYTGNDGGIWRSANSGATWKSLNTAGFSATQFESIAVHPTNGKFTIGGTQDNGTEFRNGTGAWKRADFGDGGFSAIDQTATNTTTVTMYHTYFNQKQNLLGYAVVTQVANAKDGSWSFKGCNGNVSFNGIGCSDNTLFYAPLALGPGTPNTVYFGTDRLYRSANKGVNNNVVSQAPITSGAVISAIGISPQDDNYRIVGLNNGRVWRTVTGSSTLSDVTGTWPLNYVARVVIDPTAKNTAYVTLDGFTGGTAPSQSHVWKTTNLGNATPTWTAVNTGLPDVPVNSFVVDPNNAAHVFAGTDIGVFDSIDGGATWNPFGTGLPIVAVFDMAVASPGTVTEKLRVATHGKGMWEISLAP
jgi:hypothetical protein